MHSSPGLVYYISTRHSTVVLYSQLTSLSISSIVLHWPEKSVLSILYLRHCHTVKLSCSQVYGDKTNML